MKWLAAMTLAAAAPLQSPDLDGRDLAPTSIRVDYAEGKTWVTVRAQNAPFQHLIEELARKLDYDLVGYEEPDRAVLVSVHLDQRRLGTALEYLFGSVGLRAAVNDRTITVLPDLSLETDARTMLDVADAAWFRASRTYPDHEYAPLARLALGEIAEKRGNAFAALDHYMACTELFVGHAIVPRAYLRAGELEQSLGRWADAASRFRAVSNLQGAQEHHSGARLELARCTVEMGDAMSGLMQLEALDESHPTTDPIARIQRQFVRAQALQAVGQDLEALRVLDRIDTRLDEFDRERAMRVRALALEDIDPAEAARAWLIYAGYRVGEERTTALENAARLALSVGQDVAVLFVVREARRTGQEAALAPYEKEARERLGLTEVAEPARADVTQRVELAESDILGGNTERAADTLEPLYIARGALSDDLGVRVVVAWSRCVERRHGLDRAIEVLRESREDFDDLEHRAAIDVAAARTFERNDRFVEAVDAYEGRY